MKTIFTRDEVIDIIASCFDVESIAKELHVRRDKELTEFGKDVSALLRDALEMNI